MSGYGDVGDFSKYLKGARSAEKQHIKRVKTDCGSFFGEKNSCSESFSNFINDNEDFTKSIITKSVSSRVGKNGRIIKVERGYDPTEISTRQGNASSGIEKLARGVHKIERRVEKAREHHQKQKEKKEKENQNNGKTLNANAKTYTVTSGGNVHP